MWEMDNKAECWRIDAFELWCLRRLLWVPWTARRSNQSILKAVGPEYSLEGLMLKLQYFCHLMRTDSFEKPWCWERLKAGGEGMTEGAMVGRHHRLNGHEFEQDLGVGDGQWSQLACCSQWGCKESDATEWLSLTEVLGRNSFCCNLLVRIFQRSWRRESRESVGQSRWGMLGFILE